MLDIEKIKNYTPSLIGLGEIRSSAVLIPLIKREGDYDILFEVRSENIVGQPGDVCLPGGGIEPGESPEEAAVRECCEELLVKKEQIEILGGSDIFHREAAIIYPFAALLKDYHGTFSTDEVSRVFTVPLSFFENTEPEVYLVDYKVEPRDGFPFERIKGGRNYKWRARPGKELFYEYDGTTIWGLTARVINSFITTLKS